jgi:mitogen-activated protein kinase 1/3
MSYVFIVMEYIESDLKKMLINTNIIDFDQSHILTILYNSLCALNFIHSANIMHRDIKPANILIDSNCQIKICDFGLSRTLLDSSYDKLIGIKSIEQ